MLFFGMPIRRLLGLFPGGITFAVPAFKTVKAVGANGLVRLFRGADGGFRVVA
jgi:hypothetical protein